MRRRDHQARARAPPRAWQRGQGAAPRQALVEREQVVKLHAQPELQRIEEGRPVQREKERQRKDEMRSDAQEDLALAHVASDEREVEELEIAQPAVDQPGRPGSGAGAEVGLLDDRDGEPAKGRVARDARPDDPAAYDEEIDGTAAERPHRLISCGYLFALLYLSIASFTSAAAASRACCEVACPSRTDSIIFCVRARACAKTPSTAPLVIRFCGELRIWSTGVWNCGYFVAHSFAGASLYAALTIA